MRIVPPAFSLRFRFRHVWHNGGRDVGSLALHSLALQQPLAGFLTALPGFPMRCVFRVAGQNQLGLLTHVIHPFAHNDDLPPSVPLGMDGDAPGVMGSPELEDRYALVIENVCARREPARGNRSFLIAPALPTHLTVTRSPRR